jgi:hypothetical protein
MMYADSVITMSNDSIKSHKKQTRNMGIASWMSLATCVLGAYHTCSDGDFSFCMTLSSMCSAFGMVMLCLQFATAHNLSGISVKSLQLQTATFFCRVFATLFHEGYLPLDRSGDFIYRASEFVALGSCCVALYLSYFEYGNTYEVEKDTFGNFSPTDGDRSKFGALWIATPALMLALFVHPSLNNSFVFDVAWTFALFVDVLAVVPQLFMFHNCGGRVAPNTAHYVFSLGFGRLLQLFFWSFSYHELAACSHGGFVGVFVILAQVVGVVLMADFFYYYAKSQQKGGPMMLPSAADMI